MINFAAEMVKIQQGFADRDAKAPVEYVKMLRDFDEDLLEADIKKFALRTGAQIPDFFLPNASSKMVNIKDLYSKKTLVIKFYRGQWCPYCSLELRKLQELLSKIENCPANLVAISPQTPDNSLSTAEKYELTFEVLSDVGNKVAHQFKLAYTIPPYLNDLYLKFGLDFQYFNGKGNLEIPMPATYVVDRSGKIVFDYVPNFPDDRQNPQSIVDFLESNREMLS